MPDRAAAAASASGPGRLPLPGGALADWSGDPRGRRSAARADPARGRPARRRRGRLRRPARRTGRAGATRPTIDVYLYDIREDLRRRERGLINEYDDDGAGGRAPPAAALLQAVATWSRPGPSGPRTSTACCRRCWRASCGTTRCRPTCSTGPLAEIRPARAAHARAAAAGGPRRSPTSGPPSAASSSRRSTSSSPHPIDTGQRYEVGPPVTEPPGACRWRHRGMAAAGDGPRAPPAAGAARDGRAADPEPPPVRSATGGPDERRRARAPARPGGARRGRASARSSRPRRADDPAPDDPFRGLYLSDEAVDRLLDPTGQVPA